MKIDKLEFRFLKVNVFPCGIIPHLVLEGLKTANVFIYTHCESVGFCRICKYLHILHVFLHCATLFFPFLKCMNFPKLKMALLLLGIHQYSMHHVVLIALNYN